MIDTKPLVVSLLVLQIAGCAGLERSSAVTGVPDAIKTGPGETLAMVVPAAGVQIYECRASATRPNAWEWAFVAPEADLFDARGVRIGRHYAGPNWESLDGSKLVGSVKARADAPSANAIPWLLLDARSVGSDGAFSKVSSIQRANTVGGTPPSTVCSQSASGLVARVSYTADYLFFTHR